jgi:enediyne biosynthesis protein E4
MCWRICHRIADDPLKQLLLLLPLVLGGGGVAAEPVESFHAETLSAGINSVYSGEWEYMVGGGVATFDCNADGFSDMLLAGGTSQAKFYRNTSDIGGALRFSEQVTGLELDKVTGAYPLDIDSDGITDLVMLRVGENVVMRGLGACKFERANEAWGFDGGDAWSAAFAATWERGADWPTLVVGNYINRNEEISPWGSCTDNWLHRPAAPKQFAKPLALKPSHCALSMLFTDWNRSGTPSLRITNDREYYEGGSEQMWRVEAGKEPSLYGEADGWKTLRVWGMGLAGYDIDLDRYPEYFITSMADNKLQALTKPDAKPRPTYTDIAFKRGATAHRPYTGGELKPSTAWHTQFEDINNDGRVDLFIAKGNVAEMPDFARRDPNNLLIQGNDGKFTEIGDKAGVASLAIARGAALDDFNLDGKLDLVVVNRWSNAELWRNTTRDAGHWVQLRLSQKVVNRDAIGAWVEVKFGDKTIRREVTVGGGHASGQLGWRHFGIGDATNAEVRVLWPDGTADAWQRVAGDGFYVFERGMPAKMW